MSPSRDPVESHVFATPFMELQQPRRGRAIPTVEGPAFTVDGKLVFLSIYGDDADNKVFIADLDAGVIEPIYGDATSTFAGTAIHPDGTLYVADLGQHAGRGRVVQIAPDGSWVRTVVDEWRGTPIYPDDLVFDRAGNLYFNDMQGNVVRPTGRVFRLSASGQLELLTDGLASPNGIAFDPSGTVLWNSEHAANRLIAMRLDEHGRLDHRPFPGSAVKVKAHLSGGEVDSLSVDAAGNVYAAMYLAGRVDVFDGAGSFSGTVRPVNERHQYPHTTHVVIRPGSADAYLLAAGTDGAMLFSFIARSKAQQPFSHAQLGAIRRTSTTMAPP